MRINRVLKQEILTKLALSDKGIMIYGARQVGKTTLVTEIIADLGLKTLVVNGDERKYADTLSSRTLSRLKDMVSGYEMLVIDEAQMIPEIGINIKIILDNIPGLRVVVTGSSALDLRSKISEPLTGRIWTYRLYPISQGELSKIWNPFELETRLEERLIFGSYPEIFSIEDSQTRVKYLQNLAEGYLYKDLIEFGGLKNSDKIKDLLKLLAYQIGSEVSLSEVGNSLDMSKDTVSKYIDLLEKSFVIFRHPGFSRNLRKEVGKMDKIYFYDSGVRNALIDNFRPIKDRNDVGQLWENFLIVERLKKNAYGGKSVSTYFWRTYTGAELDLVEETGGRLYGYEFKYGGKLPKAPASWLDTYPGSTFETINRENWQKFVI